MNELFKQTKSQKENVYISEDEEQNEKFGVLMEKFTFGYVLLRFHWLSIGFIPER